MKKQKVLIVEMSDRTRWLIPASMIARNRAKHYANKDTERFDEDWNSVYNSEMLVALADDYTLKDWAANNMNWKDVLPYVRKIEPTYIPNYSAEWTNAPMTIEMRKL